MGKPLYITLFSALTPCSLTATEKKPLSINSLPITAQAVIDAVAYKNLIRPWIGNALIYVGTKP
jgi:hypothetical protein